MRYRNFLLLGFIGGAGAMAQPAPTDPTAPDPVRQNPLAGPKVNAPSPRASMVEHGFNGEVKLPETTPEEAALGAMRLDTPDASPAQREAHARAREILDERAAFLDELVAGNLELLSRLDGADARPGGEKAALAWAVWEKVRPLREKGLLQDRVREVLPEAERARFDAILNEFWREIIAERRTKPKPDGKKPGRIEIIAAVRFESFGKEIERSFYRIIQSGRLLFEYSTRDLKLTKEQERSLRDLAAEHAKKGDNASEEDNRKLFLKALFVLDESQRPKFIRNLKGM